MRKVLTRAVIGIAIAMLINAAAYAIGININKHDAYFFSKLSLLCAVPVVLGYVLSNLAIRLNNWFLRLVATALLVFNTLILTCNFFLIFGFGISNPMLFVYSSYFAANYYVFCHTIIDVKPRKEIIDFQDDILDNNL